MKTEFDVFTTKFAQDIYKQKYSMDGVENWEDTAKRVVDAVCGQLLSKEDQEEIYKIILERKFIPGGRYLYSSGRPLHQVNNCFLFRAEDSREGWAEAMNKATAALMTGGGIGFDYSSLREEGAKIKRTGGSSTGPIALMKMVNEAGRYIMQGGQRRSAIWAGLNWSHPDVYKFLELKNWPEDIKKIKETNFNFPVPMELTNISVIYDTEFFIAIEDKKHDNHKLAKTVWEKNCLQAFSTAEPGMSFNFRKDNESLRNAPVSANTYVLTKNGQMRVGDIVDQDIIIWTGKRWAKTKFKQTGDMVPVVKVKMTGDREIVCDPTHEFITIDGDRIKAGNLKPETSLLIELPKKEITSSRNTALYYTFGYIYGDGTFHKKYPRAEVTLCTKESKSCFGAMDGSLQTSPAKLDSRGYTRVYFKNHPLFDKRDKNVFPDDLYEATSEAQLAFIAGLFDADGNYFEQQNRVRLASKSKDFLIGVRRLLEQLSILSGISTAGISTYGQKQGYMLTINTEYVNRFAELVPTHRLNIKFCEAYRKTQIKVKSIEDAGYEDVFCCDVGYEEHSFMAEGVIISNCTEVVSEDDSDKCNLGTLWINRIQDEEELATVVKYATKFLLCGGIYSDVPTEGIKAVGDKNNRIGLGLGGMHEWLMLRGHNYNCVPELHKWLSIYEHESDSTAFITARKLGVSIPKGVRAIAPTGTIGILAETTTGIEPLFCKAYKRRYLKGDKWVYQYVVDGTVKRLLDKGVKLEQIQDSYDLSFKQRVKFQADVQNYVDMSISSTCNLPSWGSENNNEETLKKNSKLLLKYAKRLRGFTCYPDGCRGGQPLTRVNLEEAMSNEGVVFEENESECLNGVCGI